MTSGIPNLTKVTLNSIDVTDYLVSWKKEGTDGTDNIQTITINLTLDVNQLIDTNSDNLINLEIDVWRGELSATEYKIFKGIVISKKNDGGIISLTCADQLYLTKKIVATYSYDYNIDATAGIGSEIFIDLINRFCGTNLIADNNSVISTGNIYIFKLLRLKSESIYSKLKFLADVYNYNFYYNPSDDRIHFEPKGYTNNSTTIQSNINLVETPVWSYDESQLYNSVEVRGAQQETYTTENGQIGVTSGYTTNYVNLNYQPNWIKVTCDASNPPTTERIMGISGSTTIYDYYTDKVNAQVIWNTSTYTPNTNDYCKIDYSYMQPVPILFEDTDSILLYNNGYDTNGDPIPKKITLIKNDLKEVSDAELYAQQYLDNHKLPIITSTLKVTNIIDADIGQQIYVADNWNNVNNYFKISKITQYYPYAYDEIKVTSNIVEEAYYTVYLERRIKQLENETQQDFSILVQPKILRDDVIYENRYLQIDKTEITGGTGFILEHPVYGILESSALETITTTTTYPVLAQANNQYVELFYDTIFKNSLTTATWNTTNQQLELNSEITYTALATLPSTIVNNVKDGLKIHANFNCNLKTIIKHTGCTATKAYLYSTDGTLLSTTTFSGDTATFSTSNNLYTATDYYIVVDNNGSNYNHKTGVATFPYINTYINFIGYAFFNSIWYSGTLDSHNIISIDIEPIYMTAVSESFVIDTENSTNNAFQSIKYTIEGTGLDNLTFYIGENTNININYTEVPTTGTTTSRTSAIIPLTGINKYGLNWKVINTGGDSATMTKLIIDYTQV